MAKLMTVCMTIVLSLIMGLGLFTSGAYAQSATQGHQGISASTATGTQATLSHTDIQQMNTQQHAVIPGRRVRYIRRVTFRRVCFFRRVFAFHRVRFVRTCTFRRFFVYVPVRTRGIVVRPFMR